MSCNIFKVKLDKILYVKHLFKILKFVNQLRKSQNNNQKLFALA
jgi:hypothetical protein